MPDTVKMIIAELNGVDLDYHCEHPYNAGNQPFDNTGTTYIADSTRDAILETSTKGGQARYVITAGYGSTANNGRWYEFFAGNSSQTSPYVIAEISKLIALSFANKNNTNGTDIEVFQNGTSIATLTTNGTKTAYYVLPTPVDLVPGDLISVRQTSSPNTSEPTLYLSIKVDF